MNHLRQEPERRKWPRLPLAIPLFVRSRDERGKDYIELATAVNISAGGALVAIRRPLPLSARVFLEVPTPPSPTIENLPKGSRLFPARAVRVTHAEGCQLTGFKFSRPLVNGNEGKNSPRRKVASSV